MRIKKSGLTLLVAFVSVFGLSQTATAGDCSAQIEELRTALNDDICSHGKRKRCEGLNRKLDRVNRKIQKGKWRHAARKLANFHDVVENLAMRKKKRRISMEAYAALMEPYYNSAAVCVSGEGYVDTGDGGSTGTGGGGSEDPPLPPPDVIF